LQIHFILSIFSSKTAKKCGLSERHPEKQGLKLPASNQISHQGFLSERHPEKQGLKPTSFFLNFGHCSLSERHPEKQGLKHCDIPVEIEYAGAFRAPSRKTRIETPCLLVYLVPPDHFQSAIQKNKD